MSLPKPYYEEPGITIYWGDCRTILPHLPKVDLVLTDPPYGIGYKSSHSAATTTAEWMGKEIANDKTTKARDEVLKLFSEWACFGSIKAPQPQGWRGCLVWDKGEAAGMGDLAFPWKPNWELIFCSGNGWKGPRNSGVLSGRTMVTRKSMGRFHPNEKPIWILKALLLKHPAQTILDPFMGSGTTLRAAKDLGRKAIGIEIEEKYCEIAARRLGQEVLDLGI